MSNLHHYDRPEEMINQMVKEVSPGAFQTILEVGSRRYLVVRDHSVDCYSIVDLKAEENIDKEEVRKTTAFKKLTVYDDRYSGETFKLEINDYKKDGWPSNSDVLVYALISQFDMKEADAENLVNKITKQL